MPPDSSVGWMDPDQETGCARVPQDQDCRPLRSPPGAMPRRRPRRGPMPLLARWLAGVHAGAVGRRRGKKGTGYSPTTLEGYERSLQYVLTPEFGVRPAGEIDDREWQTWVDRLSREGLSRSRIANHLAVARAIYGRASRPTRRLIERNP